MPTRALTNNDIEQLEREGQEAARALIGQGIIRLEPNVSVAEAISN
jgi:hypothetical protein